MEKLYPVLLNEIGLHLSYEDIAAWSLTCKRYRYLTNDFDFWRYKTKHEFPELCDYWNQIKPFSEYSARIFYLWLYSQQGVTYGSEQFKTVNYCYNRAILTRNDRLIAYFKHKGVKQNRQTLKAAIKVNRFDLIDDLERSLRGIFHYEAIGFATRYGHEELSNRLLKGITPDSSGTDMPYEDIEIILGAIEGGWDDILARYNINHNTRFLDIIIHRAAKKNRQDLLDRYLIPEHIDSAFRGAWESGHIDLALKYRSKVNEYDLPGMIKSGNIESFQKYFQEFGYDQIKLERGKELIESFSNNPPLYKQCKFYRQCVLESLNHGQSTMLQYLLSQNMKTLLDDYEYYFEDYNLAQPTKMRKNHWHSLKLYESIAITDTLFLLKEGHLDVFDYLFVKYHQSSLTDKEFTFKDETDKLLYHVLRRAIDDESYDIIEKYLPLAKRSTIETVFKNVTCDPRTVVNRCKCSHLIRDIN